MSNQDQEKLASYIIEQIDAEDDQSSDIGDSME